MRQFIGLIGALVLGACGEAQSRSADHIAIVAAVLARQPDVAAERKAWLAQHPDERQPFDGLFDHRPCVAREAAGSDGDFKHDMIWKPAPSLDAPTRKWEGSRHRIRIDDQALPDHLRWEDLPLAYCPSGVLRLGNPEIKGNEARVFVENNCSAWCRGGAGEMILRRVKGRWIVVEQVSWWQA